MRKSLAFLLLSGAAVFRVWAKESEYPGWRCENIAIAAVIQGHSLPITQISNPIEAQIEMRKQFSSDRFSFTLAAKPSEDGKKVYTAKSTYWNYWKQSMMLMGLGTPEGLALPGFQSSQGMAFSDYINKLQLSYGKFFEGGDLKNLLSGETELLPENVQVIMTHAWSSPESNFGGLRLYKSLPSNPSFLPISNLVKKRGQKKPEAIKQIEELQKKQPVLELGKYHLESQGGGELGMKAHEARARMRFIVDQQLLDALYFDYPDDTIVFAHTLSASRARAFMKRYGFETFGPPISDAESIIAAPISVIRERVSENLKKESKLYTP